MNSQSEKYLFSDFTISNYKRLLELAKSRLRFTDYHEYPSLKEPFIILRHDLEFSPPLALEMAEIERDLGIKSTTFVNIHSEFYNCFDRRISTIIEKMIAMGHTMELHLDAHYYGIKTVAQLEEALLKEKKLFKDMFGIEVRSFSFHNTTPEVLGFDDVEYAGLMNIYSKKIRGGMSYCADSTGFWRYERLEDVLKSKDTVKLQLLIHDGMWHHEAISPRKRVFKVLDDNAAFLKKYYDDTLVRFNAKNVDDDRDY